MDLPASEIGNFPSWAPSLSSMIVTYESVLKSPRSGEYLSASHEGVTRVTPRVNISHGHSDRRSFCPLSSILYYRSLTTRFLIPSEGVSVVFGPSLNRIGFERLGPDRSYVPQLLSDSSDFFVCVYHSFLFVSFTSRMIPDPFFPPKPNGTSVKFSFVYTILLTRLFGTRIRVH